MKYIQDKEIQRNTKKITKYISEAIGNATH